MIYNDDDDYYGLPYEDRQCCQETATIVYFGSGPMQICCYKGGRGYTQTLQEMGCLDPCNASVLIIGADHEA